MKDSKYYTPEIEEFHVGFEYEELLLKTYPDMDPNSWVKKTITNGIGIVNVYCDLQIDEFIRVKYLDQEDIESLGFYHDEDNCYFDGKFGDIGLFYSDGDGMVKIVVKPHSSNSPVLFNGKIKNKSELKKVLKQVGIS
jgi:hypothetical protein